MDIEDRESLEFHHCGQTCCIHLTPGSQLLTEVQNIGLYKYQHLFSKSQYVKHILDESISPVQGGVETLGMEMTDMEKDQVAVSAEPQENPKEMIVGKGHTGEEDYSGIFHVDGFEDFEEFVFDFDDYDLLESIHSHLNSPVEPTRKYSQQHGLGGSWGPKITYSLKVDLQGTKDTKWVYAMLHYPSSLIQL